MTGGSSHRHHFSKTKGFCNSGVSKQQQQQQQKHIGDIHEKFF